MVGFPEVLLYYFTDEASPVVEFQPTDIYSTVEPLEGEPDPLQSTIVGL